MAGNQSMGGVAETRPVMSVAVVHVRVALLVALIAVLSVAGTARAASTGQITGRAVDASSGAAVANVEVLALPFDPTTNSSTGSATTDSSGAYTITGLAPGQYVVDFYTWPQNYVSVFYGGALTRPSAASVPVVAGQTTAGIDANLQRGGLIQGRVTNASGAPVSGISVFATLAGSTFNSIGTTDANGNYTVAGLATGSYAVSFAAANGGDYATDYYPGKPDPASAQLIAATQQQTTAGINNVMLAPGSIAGTILGPTGQPVPGVLVTVTIPQPDGTQWWGGQTTSGADGSYSVPGLAAGGWIVNYDPPESTGLWPEYYPSASTLAYARPLSVPAGGVADVNVGLVTSVCQLQPACPAPPTSPPVSRHLTRTRIHIRHAFLRHGKAVLTGTINRRRARMRVVLTDPRKHKIARSYRIRHGRFHIVMRLPHADRRLARARVALTVAGNRTHTSVSKKLRIDARRDHRHHRRHRHR